MVGLKKNCSHKVMRIEATHQPDRFDPKNIIATFITSTYYSEVVESVTTSVCHILSLPLLSLISHILRRTENAEMHGHISSFLSHESHDL
jgi:hypothetical protein